MSHGLHNLIFSRQFSKSKVELITVGLVLVLLIAGCSAARQSNNKPSDPAVSTNSPGLEGYHEKVIALQTDLIDLSRQTDMLEARQVAETAITYSGNLAQDYNLVRPAILHNVFVRIGLKDRGLCYHWTEDLIMRLQLLKLKTFQLHWGVAYRGSELREHNSVVITARGDVFEKGIVLDPWRNSGDLYWALISTDTYPWKELPPEEW